MKRNMRSPRRGGADTHRCSEGGDGRPLDAEFWDELIDAINQNFVAEVNEAAALAARHDNPYWAPLS
jgi:hypothetical protein